MLAALIVVSSLWAMTIAALVLLAQLKSRTSTPPSPTPPTTPTPPSDTAAIPMMKMMVETFQTSLREIREMVVDMTQGRPSPSLNGDSEILPTSNVNTIDYDDDSIPTHPGIEAVLDREATETVQAALLRERAESQRQLRETQERLSRLESEISLEGLLTEISEPNPPASP